MQTLYRRHTSCHTSSSEISRLDVPDLEPLSTRRQGLLGSHSLGDLRQGPQHAIRDESAGEIEAAQIA
jgi:hypothetical protein